MPTCQEVEFINDGVRLTGMLHLPPEPPGNALPPLVVGSHGLEGSMESAKQKTLARILPENGIAFFRFNHRGCGDSEGNFFTETTIGIRTADFLAAISHVLGLGKTSRIMGIFGSSMGGATCIAAWPQLANRGIDLRCGVFCAAPVSITEAHPLPVPVNSRGESLPLEFFAKNLIFDLSSNLGKLHHILVFHGDADNVVPVSNAHKILDSVQQPAKMVIQANGDHQMSNPRDQKEFETESLEWFIKYIVA